MNNFRANQPDSNQFEATVNLTSGLPPQWLIDESARLLQEAKSALNNNYAGKNGVDSPDSNYQYSKHKLGYQPFRESIAKEYSAPTEEHVMIVSGVREGINLVLNYLHSSANNRAIYHGEPQKDIILTQSPNYFRTNLALFQRGLLPIAIPENHGQLDLQSLREMVHERVLAILLTPSHCNPTGISQKNIYDVINSTDRPVILDDVYDKLNYNGSQQLIDTGKSKTGPLFLVTGPAKIIRPSNGYVILNEKVNRQAFENIYLSQTAHGGDIILQQQIWQLIHSGEMEKHLTNINRQNGIRINALLDGLYSAQNNAGEVFSYQKNITGGYFVGGKLKVPCQNKGPIKNQISSELAKKNITLAERKGFFPHDAWMEHVRVNPDLPKDGYQKRLETFFKDSGWSRDLIERIIAQSAEPEAEIFYRFGVNDQSVEGIERATATFGHIIKKIL